MDLYDEFGNFLGGGEEEEVSEEEYMGGEEEGPLVAPSSSIVLFEDRALFPSTSSVFGEDVEIIHAVSSEPSQDRSVPLVPRSEVVHERTLKSKPPTLSSEEQFQDLLTGNQMLTHTVAICGALQHGKTSICALLHKLHGDHARSPIQDERSRGISLKTRAVSSVTQSRSGKSYFIQSLDVPGHVNFLDQVECGLEICDAVILVVDCVEGIQLGSELQLLAIEQFALTGQVVVCINKLDRLIHELKLPVSEASRKIRFVVAEVERKLKRKLNYTKELCFASAMHGWCVDVHTMAQAAASSTTSSEDIETLASMLFGDVFFNGQTFSHHQHHQTTRAFDQFVLEPLYKIYSHVLGGDAQQLAIQLVGMTLSPKELQLDALPLLRVCLAKAFPHTASQVLTELVIHARKGFDWCMAKQFTNGQLLDNNALLVHLVKFVHPLDDVQDEFLDDSETQSFAYSNDVTFRVLGRIYHGTVCVGDSVLVFDPESNHYQSTIVTNIRLPLSTTTRQVTQASVGMLVLLSGIDHVFTKSGTLVRTRIEEPFKQLRMFKHQACKATVKIALEPLVPNELPKMLTGLRAIQRAYPASRILIEETGEHVLYGTGELYMDCMMKDLRRFSGIEIKVCDPFVALCESLNGQSSIRSIAETSNKRSMFSLIACPLELNLIKDLDRGIVPHQDTKLLAKTLKQAYGYDVLSSRNLWAFSEESSAFANDTLDTDLSLHKDSIVQGFLWASREGPLCEEPIRGTKFKLLDCKVGVGGTGQIAPTIRQLCHHALLQALPVLLEPLYRLDAISTSHGAIGLVTKLVEQRRGGQVSQISVPGTKLFRISALLPVLDSFGLETELRLKSKGQVFCQTNDTSK
ncbi:hypothetical protein BASA81_003080 [Batrachochytrium salamandrivorans]|nr:hypothetical protein BASA81_003080 [Batrachochytrium salamandrivorans]